MNYKTPPELKLEEENQKVGRKFLPAGLLVFRHGTRFPAVQSFLTMLLMKPAGSWRCQRSGRGAGVGECFERGFFGGLARDKTRFTQRELLRLPERRLTDEGETLL